MINMLIQKSILVSFKHTIKVLYTDLNLLAFLPPLVRGKKINFECVDKYPLPVRYFSCLRKIVILCTRSLWTYINYSSYRGKERKLE